MRKITKILTLSTPLLALAPLATLANTNTTSLKTINKEAATPSLRTTPVDITVKDSPLGSKLTLSARLTGIYHSYNDEYNNNSSTSAVGGYIENAVLSITDDEEEIDGGWISTQISISIFSFQSDELQYHTYTGADNVNSAAYIHMNIKRNNRTHQDTLNIYVKEFQSTIRTYKSFKLYMN